MIFQEVQDTKKEIIMIALSHDSRVNERSVTAARFREVENTLETCTFIDSEHFSYFENLLLQWENFQDNHEDIQRTCHLVMNLNEIDQSKVEKVLLPSKAQWKFSYNLNFRKLASEVNKE